VTVSVGRLVCLSVYLSGVLWNGGRDDQDAVWGGWLGGPKDDFFPSGVPLVVR